MRYMLSETRFIFLFYNNELVAQAHFGILGPSLRYVKMTCVSTWGELAPVVGPMTPLNVLYIG